MTAKLRFAALRVVFCYGEVGLDFEPLRGLKPGDTLHGRLSKDGRTTCSFSKYRLHGGISSAAYMGAQIKFMIIFDLGEVVPKFSP